MFLVSSHLFGESILSCKSEGCIGFELHPTQLLPPYVRDGRRRGRRRQTDGITELSHGDFLSTAIDLVEKASYV